jgi:hypothetical protein
MAIQQPSLFRATYVEMPTFSGPGMKAAKEAFLVANEGKRFLTTKNSERIRGMCASVMRNRTARMIVEDGESEVTMRWIDSRTKLRAKARFDYLHRGLGFGMDVKTTDDASSIEFGRSVAKFEYHVQHCHYSDGTRELGVPLQNFLILAVEKQPPYLCQLHHIDAAAEERGFQLLHRRMDKLEQSVRTGEWPGYPDEINTLTLPGWAFSDRS